MPAKKASIVPARTVPAKWMSIPARWRKGIVAVAVGVCTAGIMTTIGQPSRDDMQPSMNTPVENEANEPAVTQPASRQAAPRREARATSSAPVVRTAATTGSEPAVTPAVARTVQSEAATITGCLEADGDSFRLKDVEGEDAPKARSWKSGFLRRSNARVDVVDASNRLRLASHVGHRVTVAGMLAERELEARSLRMMANTCED